MQRIVGGVFVPALVAHEGLAPAAYLDVLVAEVSGALSALPVCFLGTACSRALHTPDATRGLRSQST